MTAGVQCDHCGKFITSPSGFYTVAGYDRVYHFCNTECIHGWTRVHHPEYCAKLSVILPEGDDERNPSTRELSL